MVQATVWTVKVGRPGIESKVDNIMSYINEVSHERQRRDQVKAQGSGRLISDGRPDMVKIQVALLVR